MDSKEEQAAEAAEKRRIMLKQILEPEALERLRRIELVKPEVSQRVENHILSRGGGRSVTDDELVRFLKSLDEGVRGKVQIKRKGEDDGWDW